MSSLACPRCKSALQEGAAACTSCGRVWPRAGEWTDFRGGRPLGPAAAVNLWSLTAWGYEAWRARALSLLSGRPFPLGEELGRMRASLEPVGGGVFLDLGTATGLYARALLQAGAARVYALDLSPAMLRAARRRARGLGGLVPLLARAEALPLRAASLDGVAVGGSWNEFAEPEAVALEVARVLRPGGRLWLVFTHRSGSPLQRAFGRAGLRFPRLEDLLALLAPLGFALEGWREGSAGFVAGTKLPTGE